MKTNEIKALKRLMGDEAAELFQSKPEDNEHERVVSKDCESLDELYFSTIRDRKKSRTIKAFPERIKDRDKPRKVKASRRYGDPIIRALEGMTEAQKDTKSVLTAIKSLVSVIKESNELKPSQIEVRGELQIPDHEIEVEKVVERDGLNRIRRTIATRKIVKK